MSRRIRPDDKTYLRQLERYEEASKNAPFCACGCGKKVHVNEKMLNYWQKDPRYAKYLAGHNNVKGRRDVELNEVQKQIVIGTLLGDGYLGPGNKRSTFPRLSLNHGVSQSEYMSYKVECLKDLSWRKGKIHKTSFGGTIQEATTASLPCLKPFYEMFYEKGKKVIKEKILDFLRPLGYAIWYMDDGHIIVNQNGTRYASLHTEGFTLEENEIICNHFLKNGIGAAIGYNNSKDKCFIRLTTSGTEKFLSIVKPYIIDSMRYKLGDRIEDLL